MKKRLVVPVALAALLMSVLTTSASAISSPRVIRLVDVTAREVQLGSFTFERPPAGGDQFAFVDRLYRWAGTKRGAPAGRVEGMGTFITGFGQNFSRRAVVLFVAQAYLPGGTVLVQGYGRINPNGPSRFTFPVVGGTGIYDNVRGFVRVRDLGNGESGASALELHLRP
jgi:hypothetical protein